MTVETLPQLRWISVIFVIARQIYNAPAPPRQMRCSACISARPLVTAAPFVVAAGVAAEGGVTVTVGVVTESF